MAARATWSEDTELQLISLIQQRPALYDVTQKLYSNRSVKTELWRQIERQLAVSEKELRKRWDSLRTQYARYKKLPPSGSCGALKTDRQQWILSRLRFLEPRTKRKETTSNLRVREPAAAATTDSSPDANTSDTWSEASAEPKLEAEPRSVAEFTFCVADSDNEEASLDPPSAASTPRLLKKHGRKLSSESTGEEASNLIRTIGQTLERIAQQDASDAISAYCRNIEHRMRQLPPQVLPYFQHEVDNCLFKYAVGHNQ